MKIEGNAITVLESRYLQRNAAGEVFETPDQMFRRVAETVAKVEADYGSTPREVSRQADIFHEMLSNMHFLPNSPTLMNAGRTNGMLAACVVLPIHDSIDSIMTTLHHAVLVQKAGGGTGFSFAQLRPTGDPVGSTGGTTSGPISFMHVFAEATNAIQQGAFRRGANMGIMRIDHPDIVSFIDAKCDDRKLTNFNLSVAVTGSFMNRLLSNPDAGHTVVNPRTRQSSILWAKGRQWTVREVFEDIVLRAWETGEPGIVFIDVMNAANPTPHIGSFESTNACGEQPLLPYECCNLGSIPLARFVDRTGEQVDWSALRETIHCAVRFLDDAIDASGYPFPELEQAAKANRKIGLGVMGFADLLFTLGIPYDSDDGVALGSRVMQFIQRESHRASERLARARGVFPNWEGSTWDTQGIRMRNACTTCVAPTGSISMIAGCTGGMEPAFALAYSRNVLDGRKLTELNPVFAETAESDGFLTETVKRKVGNRGSIVGVADVPERWQRIFVTAHDISPEWHIKMQAAFQEHCDASISKTINMPHGASKEDVAAAFTMAFDQGCKGVTVFRDGCRPDQPMAKPEQAPEGTTITPIDLPEIMPAVRIRQATPFGNMHVKIGVDVGSGLEREVFAQLGKGGDVANSDLEAICRMVSLYLRANGSIKDVIGQLSGIGSSFSVPTKEGRIYSLGDGLARALRKYVSAKQHSGLEALLLGEAGEDCEPAGVPERTQVTHTTGFRFKCQCGSTLVMTEGCIKCLSCGYAEC